METKDEPEKPNNSGTSQTDDLMQPQPQTTSCVTTVQDFQSIIKTPSGDKELQSCNQIETEITQDVERVNIEDISGTCQSRSPNESTDTSENRQEQSKAFANKEMKSKFPSDATCIKDSNAACQPSNELREKISQLPITENPQSHSRTETGYTNSSGSKVNNEKHTESKRMIRIDSKISTASQNKKGNILRTRSGLRSPPPVRRERRSNVRPTSIENNRGGNRPMIAVFFKSAWPDSNAKKCSDNRDIFEVGDESLNPRLNPPLGNSPSKGDEIERLSAETPSEPQVIITPTTSVEQETRISWRNLFLEKSEKQFAKAPRFYMISFLIIFISAFLLAGKKGDPDIYICLIVAFAVCILITFALEKGQWSKSISNLGETSLSGLFDRDSFCWGCFRSAVDAVDRPEPEPERHSRYNRLPEEKDTTFEHEVADVSNIDPNDCPQMKVVEHESASPGSPDSSHDIRQVNVDVHVPGTTRNSELGAISKRHSHVIYKKSAKSPCEIKSKCSSASPKLSKSVKPDGHFAETVGNLKGVPRCEHPAQAVSRGLPELSHTSDASREKLKIIGEFSTQKTKTGNIGASVLRTNPKEFKCERPDHQDTACSCAELYN